MKTLNSWLLVVSIVGSLSLEGSLGFYPVNHSCVAREDLHAEEHEETFPERCDLIHNFVCHPRTSTCIEAGNKTFDDACNNEHDLSCNYELGLICKAKEDQEFGCDCQDGRGLNEKLWDAAEWNDTKNTCCSSVSRPNCYFQLREQRREKIIEMLNNFSPLHRPIPFTLPILLSLLPFYSV